MQRISTNKADQLRAEGFQEVIERGPRGSGRTARVRENHPNHELALVEANEEHEKWLVRETSLQKHDQKGKDNE